MTIYPYEEIQGRNTGSDFSSDKTLEMVRIPPIWKQVKNLHKNFGTEDKRSY